jgi:hypothetical protein
MSAEGIIAAALMLIVGVAWIMLPLIRRSARANDASSDLVREQLTLATAYERALLAVRDLDEDYQMGKLSQEAYSAERAQWVERGGALLEALEKNGVKPGKQPRRKAASSTTEADPVEAAIAAYARAREQGSH